MPMRIIDREHPVLDRLVHTTNVLSENMEQTPEGFLLCKNVPIARTGLQEYLNDEICDEADTDNKLYQVRGKNGIVQVERREEDVFHPAAIASYEGKDVVDDHPDDPVHPGNYRQHTVGVVLNPRRGADAFANFLVADLLIKEEQAIAAVRAGKREVSGGYDADYEVLGHGRARQYNIIGNHLALVDRGRCGFRCAIGDKEPDEMSTKAKTPSILRRVMDAIANKDRQALNKAMDEMEKEDKEDKDKDAAPDAPALEATGTHIHLHLGGEEQASGSDPAVAGAADEDEPEAGKKPAPAAAEGGGDARIAALEAAVHELAESMRKLVARLGGDGAEDMDDEQQGEAEASSDVPEADADPDKEDKEDEPEPKAKDKGKAKDKTKDAAVKDSAHMKDAFAETVSGAEILSPGLKLPVFDSKIPAKTTSDSLCLLRRRALAAARRTDDGKEVVDLVLGKGKTLDGIACDALGVVFNGAVALMRDRNTKDDKATPVTLSSLRGGKAKDQAAAPTSPSDFNSMMRAKYGQPKRN